MWVVMMVAMMLPSLVPMLLRYREAVTRTAETRLGLLTAVVGMAYFCLWTLFGMVALPLGFALAEAEMNYAALSRAVPTALGVIVFIAGACQFTTWKAHHLACCRESSTFARGSARELRRDRTLLAAAGTAWRQGMRLGLHCICSSAGLTAILLAMGVMDLRVMAVVTAAITAERLAPAGEPVARAVGAIAVGAGLLLLARAAGLQ
jgi:predicted metal-binding membrane protein